MNLYIIAGTVDQYHEYCVSKGAYEVGYDYVIPHSNTRFKYVATTRSLIGTINPKGILIGTWYNRPDIMTILSALLSHMNYNSEGAAAILKAIQFLNNKVEKEYERTN